MPSCPAARASSANCSGVSAVPMIATELLHPARVQREHVRVALDDDHLARLGDRRARAVDAEELAALVVEVALGRVHVLRPLVVAHRARAEAEHAPARVGEREHDPAAEQVAEAALAPAPPEPRPGELLLVEAVALRGRA